jgi:hypothetical protein
MDVILAEYGTGTEKSNSIGIGRIGHARMGLNRVVDLDA